MGEARRREELGLERVTLTVLDAHGVVQRSASPLDPQPFRVALFGSQSKPELRQLLYVHEVDRLLRALAPHVLALAADVDQAKHADAIKTLRGVFEQPAIELPPPPSVVTA